MILGNTFFYFLKKSFNSYNLLFFIIGLLVGIVIALLIFLLLIKLGNKTYEKNKTDLDIKNKLIINYQNKFLEFRGDYVETLNEFKNLNILMAKEIADSVKGHNEAFLEINISNIILFLNNLTDKIYNLLENLSYEITEANNKLIETKKELYLDESNDFNKKITELNNLIDLKKEELKKIKPSIFKKPQDIEKYDLIKDELKKLNNELDLLIKLNKNVIKKINKTNLKKHKETITSKVLNQYKGKILDMKLKNLFNKNDNYSKTINFAYKAFKINDILSGLIPIIANELYDLYE